MMRFFIELMFLNFSLRDGGETVFTFWVGSCRFSDGEAPRSVFMERFGLELSRRIPKTAGTSKWCPHQRKRSSGWY